MGKSSPPPAPTPPTAAEISAANIESAKGLTRLQRAMQFGEELTKDGYVREGVPIPEGSIEIFEDVTTTEAAPQSLEHNGAMRVVIGSDGLVSETWHPTWDKHIGQPWQSVQEEYPELDGTGEQETPRVEKVSRGFETPSGEIIQPEKYYQIGEDGGRTEVTRDQAIEADFTGRGDTDIARKQWEFEQETSPERTQFLLDQMKQFGPEFTEQARALVERSDPTGFAARELLGQLAQEYQPAEVPAGPEMQEMGDAELTERVGDLNPLERLEQSDIPVFGEAEITGQGRGALEQALIDRAQSGRTAELMGEEASRLARGRQAATGNIFGGGAVLEESRAIRQAEDAGQRQALGDLLGLLSSGQSATDTENRFAQQNLANKLMGIEQRTGQTLAERADEYSAAGQRNQAADTDFARQQAAMGQRNQARQQAFSNAMQQTATQQQMQQQQMANLQSFSGLAPVSGQFGGLAGAQAAAGANFNPMQYTPTSAAGLLGGQQNLAGNIFGTQANIWGQQAQMANQPSGFGSILGTVAGGLAGNAGFGTMLGNKMFGGGSGASPTQIWNN